MRDIESGKDKVKQICDVLKRETLEPAKKEAEAIVQEAEKQAAAIVAQAKKEAEKLRLEAEKEIEKERKISLSSLHQACRQVVESLKQEIEEKIFQPRLVERIRSHTQDPKVVAELIEAVVHAVEKEGLHVELEALIPKSLSPKEVNSLLAQDVLEKLEKKSVTLGPLLGGVEVKLKDKHITIDISDKALVELVGNYVRKDLREMLFHSLSS